MLYFYSEFIVYPLADSVSFTNQCEKTTKQDVFIENALISYTIKIGDFVMKDFLIVGCGLYGATMAERVREAGYSCMILEKREHIAGNAYTQEVDGIHVHRYGAHIFHTSDPQIWRFVGRFAEFNRFTNCPLANYHGEIYNLPFNMNTFNRLWGVTTPAQARELIARQRREGATETPCNLEEQAISLVGPEIYAKFIKGYTQKQWGRPCDELPAFIIRRIPVRFTYDNNYFDDRWQGIPERGYTAMVAAMIKGIPLRLSVDYLADRAFWDQQARHIIYTGPIDAFFDHRLGMLEYRSLHFETERLEIADYQGNAVVNYTDVETPYTRILEHKHFLFGQQDHTIITREYGREWSLGSEPFYPVNDVRNNALYECYAALAANVPNVSFGGRLAEYRYYDMHKVIAAALERSTPAALAALLSRGAGGKQ